MPTVTKKYLTGLYYFGSSYLLILIIATALLPSSFRRIDVLPLVILAVSGFFVGIYQIRLSRESVVSICVANFAATTLSFGPVVGGWVAAVVDALITVIDNRRVRRGLQAPPPPGVTPGGRIVMNAGMNGVMFLTAGLSYFLVTGRTTFTALSSRALLGVIIFFIVLQFANALLMEPLLFMLRASNLRNTVNRVVKYSLFDFAVSPAAIVLVLLYTSKMTLGLALAATSLVLASTLLQRQNRLDLVVKRYVSPAKSMQILANPYELLKAERRDISIIFADLRGSTPISQLLTPAQFLTLLNEFHAAMIDEVIKTGATVDKILGDGLMILVGAPVREEQHAAKAVHLAVAMQRRYREVRRKLAGQGLPAPGMGIGIATGEVVLGNIGSELRTDYTAIGGAVNVASKLCGAAASDEILINEVCHHYAAGAAAAGNAPYLAGITFQPRPPLAVEGLPQPLRPVGVIY